ncbi:MAG: AMP-binding protein [Pseudoflavonifractor sp.]|nr:AMP-binding protein [Alloprevotella sp.]MCM1116855.1 AMP-binding protein [Pseudoflavonifractor sp.]
MTLKDFIKEWTSCDPFITAHTSGSTGFPKEIKLLKADMEQSAIATIVFFGIRPGDLLATPLSPDYIAGKMMAVRAMLAQASLYTETPSRCPFSLLNGDIALAAIVPQQVESVATNSQCRFRNVIVGGAPLAPEQEEMALSSSSVTAWWATYGMTETCSHVALRRLGELSYTALPGIRFATDDRGCLVISRQGASWSPVVTNDVVELVSPTEFRFIGRADNTIVSGAVKIHPEEVEKLIAPALDGRRFYVTSRPSERWGQEVILVVEGKAMAGEEAAILEKTAALAGHIKAPKGLIFIDSLQLTSSGKIKRERF